MTANDRMRLGMVGGGQRAFIGTVHRVAARLDDAYELVCGALSSDVRLAHLSPPLKLGVRFIAASIRSSAEGSRWLYQAPK